MADPCRINLRADGSQDGVGGGTVQHSSKTVCKAEVLCTSVTLKQPVVQSQNVIKQAQRKCLVVHLTAL